MRASSFDINEVRRRKCSPPREDGGWALAEAISIAVIRWEEELAHYRSIETFYSYHEAHYSFDKPFRCG